MTHGGSQKLGNGMALTYTRQAVTPTRATVAGRPTEEPISVDVSVRSTFVENTCAGRFNHDSAPGQHLDCYI